MRKWLAIVLLVLTPLQFSWAVAASYCQHETGTQASHFGHHEHKHQGAKVKTNSTDRSDAAGKLGTLDNDCPGCHLSCASLIASSQAASIVPLVEGYIPALTPRYESHISKVPQRPDWSLAA